ncbi:hypothetical protein Efla_001233 [Eimeria flavescens]
MLKNAVCGMQEKTALAAGERRSTLLSACFSLFAFPSAGLLEAETHDGFWAFLGCMQAPYCVCKVVRASRVGVGRRRRRKGRQQISGRLDGTCRVSRQLKLVQETIDWKAAGIESAEFYWKKRKPDAAAAGRTSSACSFHRCCCRPLARASLLQQQLTASAAPSSELSGPADHRVGFPCFYPFQLRDVRKPCRRAPSTGSIPADCCASVGRARSAEGSAAPERRAPGGPLRLGSMEAHHDNAAALQQMLLLQQQQLQFAQSQQPPGMHAEGGRYQQALQPSPLEIGPAGYVGAARHQGPSGSSAGAAPFGIERSGSESAVYRRNRRKATLKLMLVAVVLVSFLCNFDHGVIPAILSEIQKNFNNQIKFVEQSLFGSLVYFGLIVGSLFAGKEFPVYMQLRGSVCLPGSRHTSSRSKPLFLNFTSILWPVAFDIAGIFLRSYGAKWLLVGSLLCLSSSLFFFSSADSLLLMYFMRFITGLCQAVPVVYFPVWVDDFAPDGQVTRWMSYTQLAGIGGTVGGYFFGGVFSRFTSPSGESKWRTPFFVQSLALIPVLLLLAAMPASLVNLPDRSQPRPERQRTGLSTIGEADTAGQSCMHNVSSALVEVKSLLRNPLYVVVTMGMSALYFVVTGIQFWVTEFLVSVLHFQKLSVIALSTFCFLTAPTSGVWFGGYVCDLCGGYRGGGQQRIAVRVTTLFAGIGASLAVSCIYVESFLLFAILIWGCLFFGAALVPVAVGIQLASVPFHQRSISSALSQFAYNMFGWFSAPLVSGVVMDFIDWCHPAGGKELALRFGFEMILWVTLVGFVLFAIANTLTFPSEDIEKEELELQLARTRMPTLSF